MPIWPSGNRVISAGERETSGAIQLQSEQTLSQGRKPRSIPSATKKAAPMPSTTRS